VSEKPRILFVEDDLDLSEMLTTFFGGQGYEIQAAAWGEEALHLAHDFLPDLVVLDIRLPDIDGFEVCRRLRAQHRTQHVPVIFLTEKRDRVHKLSGLGLGVVDYITKPFDIQELRLRVRNVLQRTSKTAIINAVTRLPEGPLVDERLNAMLGSDEAWAVLLIRLMGLDSFRDWYGFVAADDVLRAASLLIRNAVRGAGTGADLVAHLSAHEFLVVTDEIHIGPIRERIEARLAQTMAYFYPLKDRDKVLQAQQDERLRLTLGQISHASRPFDSLDALKQTLRQACDASA